MSQISSAEKLLSSIQDIESELEFRGNLLKDQLYKTIDYFRPINILKSSIKETFTSSNLIQEIVDSGMSFVSGYLAKTGMTGHPDSKLKRVIGPMVMSVLSKYIFRNAEVIKTVGIILLEKIANKWITNPNKPK